MTTLAQRVTAIPCGQDAYGRPITARYTYLLVRDPEDLHVRPDGRAVSRLWGRCEASARHGLERVAPLGVVWTDSIMQAATQMVTCPQHAGRERGCWRCWTQRNCEREAAGLPRLSDADPSPCESYWNGMSLLCRSHEDPWPCHRGPSGRVDDAERNCP